jgi:hypothetical protein
MQSIAEVLINSLLSESRLTQSPSCLYVRVCPPIAARQQGLLFVEKRYQPCSVGTLTGQSSRLPPLSDADTQYCQSYVTTNGQPASLSWNKAPIWGLRPDLNYYLTVAGLLIWGALSDEKTGLPVAIATGPRQRSHFRVNWTRGHILLSQIRDFPFRRLLLLAGSRWRYSTPPPHG